VHTTMKGILFVGPKISKTHCSGINVLKKNLMDNLVSVLRASKIEQHGI